MQYMPPEDRPSLADLQARARGEGKADPSACPRCGCRHVVLSSPVDTTYLVRDQSERKRSRICRNCGNEVFPTSEVYCPKGFRVLVVPEDELDIEDAA